MRNLDFSSLHALVTTLLSLAVITLIGVGVRLLTMFTVQQRRERMNRQINERLRALIAAYKTLGGSFTGDLTVDPTHHRDLSRKAETAATQPDGSTAPPLDLNAPENSGSDRTRRVRDAVEAALSDIILLGTQEQVAMAARAAQELAGGKLVHTQDLVVSLRAFIREALDLDPVPPGLAIPPQGPARPSAANKDKGDKAESRQGGGGGGGGGGGMGMGGGGGGGSFGLGSGSHLGHAGDDEEDTAASAHSI